jgi:2-haloacid dehalogenase
MIEINAILFDVFGTLVDWRGSLIRDFTSWSTKRGRTVNWPGLVDAWRAAYVPSMDRVRTGASAWANLDALHRESLQQIGPQFGLPDISDSDRDYLVHGWHRLDPWPDSAPGLRRLKTSHIIAPLSNGNLSLLVDLARHAAFPWDAVFSAELFQHYKPDPETYLGAAHLLDLPPERVLMAAAHNGDLRAARALGLRTAFIARPYEYGPNQTQDRAPKANWDFVASNVEDLARQLLAEPGSPS